MFKFLINEPQKVKVADGTKTKSSGLRWETKHSLWVLLLAVVSFLLLLSLFGSAGKIGDWIYQALHWLAGSLGYLIPFVFLILTYALLRPGFKLLAHHVLGIGLFFVGLTGLFHTGVDLVELWQRAGQGYGGGYLGYLSFVSLYKIVGYWAAILILIALVIAGLLILLETTLRSLFSPLVYTGKVLTNVWHRQKKDTPSSIIDDEMVEMASVTNEEEDNTGLTVRKIRGLVPAFKARKTKTTELVQEPLLQIKETKKPVDVPIDLLKKITSEPNSGNIEARKEIIQHSFANFGIEVEMGEVSVGPTVTQYTLKPADGVKLSQITALANDLALALAAHPIRIEAPIPGRALVGIEVPNQAVATVGLREILERDSFRKRRSNLTIGLGKDVSGKAWVADIESMPHMLVAGSTGSGKSVCINAMLISLLYTNSPDDLKLIVVDPKKVEMASYSEIPHLLTPVITDVNKTINALKWVVAEMDRRYQVLANDGKRNIQAFNQAGGDMPYILVVIDEFANLMSVAANDVEATITRLAQMARAVGIHLIVATQRPSVDVITGLIKANITNRIAFAVASGIDSRTILDTSGAEKLLGKGDCLYISPQLSKPKRLQGAFVSDEEIERVVNYWRDKAKPQYNSEVITRVSSASGIDVPMEDDMFEDAKRLVIRTGKASATFLQRRLRIGFARAGRLIDLLEQAGVVGPGDGAKPRELLVGPEALQDDIASLSQDLNQDSYGEEDLIEDEADETEEAEYTDQTHT